MKILRICRLGFIKNKKWSVEKTIMWLNWRNWVFYSKQSVGTLGVDC